MLPNKCQVPLGPDFGKYSRVILDRSVVLLASPSETKRILEETKAERGARCRLHYRV